MKISISTLAATLFTIAGSYSAAQAQQLQDQDLKLNIGKITNSTERIKSIDPVQFTYNTAEYKALNLPAGAHFGFLANNVKNVLPEVVTENSKVYTTGKNTTKTAKFDEVDSASMIPLLVAAIKEQQEQIEKLQKTVEELKNKSE